MPASGWPAREPWRKQAPQLWLWTLMSRLAGAAYLQGGEHFQSCKTLPYTVVHERLDPLQPSDLPIGMLSALCMSAAHRLPLPREYRPLRGVMHTQVRCSRIRATHAIMAR